MSPEPDAAEHFQRIQAAYDVLSDPAARASFDASLGPGTGSGSVNPAADHGAGARSGQRASPRQDAGVPDGWTPPWVRDWKAETWLKAHAAPLPWSLRKLAEEARTSRKTLSGSLAVLALFIAACALLDWAIPGIGTVLVAAVFTLPFFVSIPLLLRWANGAEKKSPDKRRSRGR